MTSPDQKPRGRGIEPTSSNIEPPRVSMLDRPGSLSRLFGENDAIQSERRRLILIVGVPVLVALVTKIIFDR